MHLLSMVFFLPTNLTVFHSKTVVSSSLLNSLSFDQNQWGGDFPNPPKLRSKESRFQNPSKKPHKKPPFWNEDVSYLVVSTHLKNMSQNGFIFPNFGGENEKSLSCHHLEDVFLRNPKFTNFHEISQKKKRERHRNVTWLEAKVHDQLMPFHARLGERGATGKVEIVRWSDHDSVFSERRFLAG